MPASVHLRLVGWVLVAVLLGTTVGVQIAVARTFLERPGTTNDGNNVTLLILSILISVSAVGWGVLRRSPWPPLAFLAGDALIVFSVLPASAAEGSFGLVVLLGGDAIGLVALLAIAIFQSSSARPRS